MTEREETLNAPTEILDLEEARRRLPEVRAHLERVMVLARRLRRLSADAMTGASGAPAEVINEKMAEAETQFRVSLKAMNDLGAYLKDPETGLLDFYTWRDDELVFLCWRHGEDTIRYWHGIDEGFAGRKAVEDA